MTAEDILLEKKVIKNRIDHTMLYWREYENNFSRYTDRLVIYGGQDHERPNMTGLVSKNKDKKYDSELVVPKCLANTIRNCVRTTSLYEVVSNKWSILEVQDEKAPKKDEDQPKPYFPVGRRNHVAAIFNNHMIVYGGMDDFQKNINDVSCLDLKSRKWTRILGGILTGGQPVPGVQPPAINRAAACLVLHQQREFQQVDDLNAIPLIDWKKAQDII